MPNEFLKTAAIHIMAGLLREWVDAGNEKSLKMVSQLSWDAAEALDNERQARAKAWADANGAATQEDPPNVFTAIATQWASDNEYLKEVKPGMTAEYFAETVKHEAEMTTNVISWMANAAFEQVDWKRVAQSL